MDMPNPNKPRTATEMLKKMIQLDASTVKFNFAGGGTVTVTFDLYDVANE
jgi:hypothetical protein